MDSSVPDNTQIKPVNYAPSKKPLLIISLLLLTLLVGIGILITLLFGRNRELQTTLAVPTPSVTVNNDSEASSSSDMANQEFHTLMYRKGGNIWSVRSDGTQLRQITRDGDDSIITYPSYQFIGGSAIVYVRCDGDLSSCVVTKRDIVTNVESIILEIPTLITYYALSSEDKPVYAYITRGLKGASQLVVNTGENEESVIEFAGGLGRGGSLDDETSLQFSPNGQFLLAVNTGTQPNLEDNKTTIWIVDTSGKVVDTIEGNLPSNAIWETNNRIIYKDGATVYRKTISSEATIIGEINGYDFDLSDDGNTLLYWVTISEGLTAVNTYALSDGTIEQISQNLSDGKWISDEMIAALETEPETEGYLGFSTNGLVNYSLTDQQTQTLDSSPTVFNFIVSP